MARIYSSRLLLDPSVLQMANAAMQNRIANETGIRKWLGQSVGAGIQSALQNIGGAIDSGYKMYKDEKDQAYRRDQINNYMSVEQLSDPLMRAAAEEYVRTGDSGKMSQYILGREAAEARKAAAAQSAQERSDTKKLHDAVRAENARKEFAENLRGYNAAETEAEKLHYKLANQALEAEYGNIFGQTMKEYEKARNTDLTAAALKEAEKKKVEDTSYSVKNWIRENIIPLGAIKTKKDQIEIADFIRDSKGLTDEDRKELLDEVLKNETMAEKNKKAAQYAVASKIGEATGKQIDDVKAEKDLAKKAKDKRAKGLKLWKDEQEALDKYGDKI